MKKILMAVALIACLVFPLSSMALTTIDDSDLSTVTGQAGVSINADLKIDVMVDTLAWGDADGFAAFQATNTDGAGWVGLTDLDVNAIRIRLDNGLIMQAFNNVSGMAGFATTPAIQAGYAAAATTYGGAIAAFVTAYNTAYSTALTTNAAGLAIALEGVNGDPTTLGAYAAFGAATVTYNANTNVAYYNAYTAYEEASASIIPIMIDVATDGTHGPGVTFVRIGLGSIEIGVGSLDATAKLMPNAAGNVPSATTQYTLGSIYMEGMYATVDYLSYVDIFNARGAGQQGVSIYANVTINEFSVDTLAWGDSDGLTNNALLTAGHTPLPGNLVTGTDTTDQGWVGLKGLNIEGMTFLGQIDIDVATDATDWTYVNIGFDSGLAIGLGQMDATVALGAAKTNLDQELGSIYLSALDVDLAGSLKIGARADGTQGVTIDISDLTIDISPFTVSWGDSDGMGAGTTAGYVGLKNLAITTLAPTGVINIDVASLTAYTTALPATWRELMYASYPSHQMSPTFVHIGFGSTSDIDAADPIVAGVIAANALGIEIASISGDVVFGDNKALNNYSGANGAFISNTMGSFYIGGVTVGVNGWVDIAAH